MTAPLHDQPARDRFQSALDTNFCISAGAGVGKTTAIVRRVAQLASRDPESLARLVVVTYTKSAAEELRVRARSLLLRDPTGEGTHRSHLLPRFRQAFFGTIHSFCLKLVRDYGAALGITPDTQLLEQDSDQEELLWAKYCESPALDALALDRPALEEVTRFISFDELLAIAHKIDPTQAGRLLAFDEPQPRPPFDFTQSLADTGGKSPGVTRRHQEMLRRFLADFAEGAVFLRIPSYSGGGGKFLETYQFEMFPFASWLDRQAARLASRIALGYRDFRRDQALMTYADQIAWCRLLLDTPSILDELRRRDWIVLLDEAQDTDAAMFAILSEVTRPPAAPVGQWPDNPAAPAPRPGRFCFVGDEQQSIFASRANLAVYRKYIDAYAAGLGGERLEFSVTMRCPQRVIGAVNAIFFQDGRLIQTHFAFRELRPKPDCVEGAAWLLPIDPLPGDKISVEAAFHEECRQLAAFLNQYGPPGLGVEQWNDIAILCPRRAWLREATDTFIEAGLPCRLISDRRLQLELPERSWPAALLHVLLNPWDRFELLGILRELFAVSDVDLADAQAANNPFTFWSQRALSPRLSSALTLLRDLHAAAPCTSIPHSALRTPHSLAQYVDLVLDSTALSARLAAIGQRADALPRLRLDALRAEISGAPLRQWVAHLIRDLNRPAPQISSVDNEIQLLTCQKAKGLEWPVVIPLGLARSIKQPGVEYPRIEETAADITVHISSVTVNENDKQPRELARREELQRLFYVTLTRAKSLLILPDSLRLYKKSSDNFLDLCRCQATGWETLFETPHPLGPSTPSARAPAST